MAASIVTEATGQAEIPWDQLPVEVQLRVLSLLNARELSAFSEVSKECYSLSQDATLWRTLNLGKMCRNPNVQKLAMVHSKLQHVRHLSFKGVHYNAISIGAITRAVVACGPRLESLDMAGCGKLKDDGLIGLLKECPNLTSLHLRGCYSLTDKSVIQATKLCPKLTELGLSQIPQLTSASLRAIGATVGRQLNTLYLRSCVKLDGQGFVDFFESMGGVSKLERLDLAGVQLGDELLHALRRSCPYLTTLYLDDNRLVTSDALTALLSERRDQFLLLGLHHCTAVDTQSILTVAATQAATLRSLYLYETPVADEAIIAVSEQCSKLEYLDCTGCHRMTDRSLAALSVPGRVPLLRRFFCGGCRVTELGIRAVLNAHPTMECEAHLIQGRPQAEGVNSDGEEVYPQEPAEPRDPVELAATRAALEELPDTEERDYAAEVMHYGVPQDFGPEYGSRLRMSPFYSYWR